MPFVIGLFGFLISGVLMWNAFAHRKAALAAKELRAQSGAPEPKLHPSLSIMADVAPFFVTLFLIGAGLLFVAAFFALRAEGFFTPVDLAGVLAMLAAYGYWFTIRTQYRKIEDAG